MARAPESGSVLVETAIVLPLFACVVVGILQLALLEQARLLTEYAAYQAVRAGVVWHGDPQRMEDAAAFALAPTACPTRVPLDSAVCGALGKTGAGRQAASIAALDALSAAGARGGQDFPGMRVDILSPYWPAHEKYFRVAGGEEMDFDDVGDDADAGYREANLLTIRVLYWYELKIPLADSVVWAAFWARLTGKRLAGSLEAPVLARGPGGHSILEHGRLEEILAGGDPAIRDRELNRGTYEPVPARGLRAMVASAGTGRFFVPIVAHATMRMQSNFHAAHVRGCSCSTGQGCDDTCRAW